MPFADHVVSHGDGLWNLEKGVDIHLNHVYIEARSFDGDSLCGTVRVTHNCAASKQGLLYTDGVTKDVIECLRKHPLLGQLIEDGCGSEQGMQDEFVLDLDVDIVPGTTFEFLRQSGFTYEETPVSYTHLRAHET